jgi:hypothetical protein
MVQIGNVPEIIEVKSKLENLKKKGLVKDWELPYENLLTRLDAAIFFITPNSDAALQEIWKELGRIPKFVCQANEKQTLSKLAWDVRFNATAEAMASSTAD